MAQSDRASRCRTGKSNQEIYDDIQTEEAVIEDLEHLLRKRGQRGSIVHRRLVPKTQCFERNSDDALDISQSEGALSRQVPTNERWSRLRNQAFHIVDRARTRKQRFWRWSRRDWQRKACQIVHSQKLEPVAFAVVLLNAVGLAVEVDLNPPEDWPHLFFLLVTMEKLFVIFYCAEASIKALSFEGGFREALQTSARFRLEFLAAVAGVLDCFVLHRMARWKGGGLEDVGLTSLSCLRLVRFTRMFYKGQLEVISKCFFPALGTLTYVSMFLLLLIFVFSVPVVKLIGQNPIWQDDPEVGELFGTMPRTVTTLLHMMVAPDTDLMKKLSARQVWCEPFFLVFVGMTTYTTMSIIVGSVTDSYKDLADIERARASRAQRDHQERLRAGLLRVLREADDEEGQGLERALSVMEFTRRLQSSDVQLTLQQLGANEDVVSELLALLQIDGKVYYEEFVDALGLLGQAVQATDLIVLRAHLSDEVRHLEKSLLQSEARLTAKIEAVGNRLEQRLAEVCDKAKSALT
eukprot:TRINITY_DN15134_c1_g1_i1.p1 TRINITY_DN15134_c1_g1~~TRINITY_DN15134_c1_g1_i1.p1  ORF type:complete len:521 (+),score=93.54 TRINITY_DN15134_c1_g1_i1:52-1614(+)